jgi:hypothetical protein
MTVGALVIILENKFATIGATGYLACDINATRWAGSCAVAYLMAAFWTLNYHLIYYLFLHDSMMAETDFPQAMTPEES